MLAILLTFLCSRSLAQEVEELEYYLSVPSSVFFSDTRILERFEPDGRKEGRIKFYSNSKNHDFLEKEGILFHREIHPGKLSSPESLVMGSPLPSWDKYPTYPEYLSMMQMMEDSFPSICKLYDFGNSVNNRELLMLKISDNVQLDEAEPEFMYSSTMHGDETGGYVFTLRFAYELLTGYGSDPAVTRLVDSIEIFINPLFNPDGTYANSDTSVWGATRFNANGYDLNRNFPDPDDGNFPGGPRQPETQYMMDFMASRNFHLLANFHSGAEVVNYPWDTWQKRHADDSWFIAISRKYAESAQFFSPPGYMDGFNSGITNGYDWYPIAGGRQDYSTYFLRGREVTLEISDAKVLPSNQLPNYYDYNKRSMIDYLEQSLYGFQGLVKDSFSLEPLVAEISIPGWDMDNSSVFSDSSFGFFVRFLDSGIYDITVSAIGYQSKTLDQVLILPNALNWNEIYLQPISTPLVTTDVLSVRISPNPGTDQFLIETTKNDRQMHYSIFDPSGKMVLEGSLYSERPGRFLLYSSELNDGIYLISFQSAGLVSTPKKLLINR